MHYIPPEILDSHETWISQTNLGAWVVGCSCGWMSGCFYDGSYDRLGHARAREAEADHKESS